MFLGALLLYTTSAQAQLSVMTGGTNATSPGTTAAHNIGAAATGTDINTSDQVTATHLASPLPLAQGGTASIVGATMTYNSVTNNATTGTVLNNLVSLDSTQKAISTPITATGGVLGICTGNCGTAASPAATIATGVGPLTCNFDATTVVACDYVQVSTTSAGHCNDTGINACTGGTPTSTVIGIVGSTGGAGNAAYAISFRGSDLIGATSGSGGSGTINSSTQGYTPYYPTTNGTTLNGTADQLKAAAFGFATGSHAGNDTAMNNLIAAMKAGTSGVSFPAGTYEFPTTNQIDLVDAFNGTVWSGAGGGNTQTTGSCATILKFDINTAPISITGNVTETGNTVTFNTASHTALAVGSFFLLKGNAGQYNGMDYQVATDNGTVITATHPLSGLVAASPDWIGSTSYAVGKIVQPTLNNANKSFFQATTAGTSAAPGAGPNPWNQTNGGSQSDGTVVWVNIGTSLGAIYTALPFVLDRAHNMEFRNICFQGVGTAVGSEGNQVMFSSIQTHTTYPSPSTVYGGAANFWNNVGITGVYIAWAASADISNGAWANDTVSLVAYGFYGGYTQAANLSNTTPNFHCDTACLDFDGNSPSYNVFNGYMTVANCPNANAAVLHWEPTFLGQATIPNTFEAVHFEVYCATSRIIDDDSNQGAWMQWKGGSWAAGSGGAAPTGPVFQLNRNFHLELIATQWASGQTIQAMVLLDTDNTVGTNSTYAPSFILEDVRLPTAGDMMPQMQTCTANSTPPAGCVSYAFSNGIADGNGPRIIYRNVMGQVGSSTQVYYNYESYNGRDLTSAIPFVGGISTKQLGTPATPTSCVAGSGAGYYVEVAAADANGGNGSNGVGWTPFSGEYLCPTGPSSVAPATPLIVTVPTPLPGAQEFIAACAPFANGTGTEKVANRCFATTCYITSCPGTGNTPWTANSTGSLQIAGHILTTTGTPTAGSCGTSPGTPTGTDNNGKIAAGTTTASCVVNFTQIWGTAPNCIAQDQTTIQALKTSSSTSALTITAASALGGDTLTWQCGSTS